MKIQIWVAISVYALVAILKKQLHLENSLYKILQILSISLFEKTPILRLFSHFDEQEQTDDQRMQLYWFDL